MAWHAETASGLYALGVADATQRFRLGTVKEGDDPDYGRGEFIYLSGVASTVVGSWVRYNQDDWSTSLVSAGGVGHIAVAIAAVVAGQYGWYQIRGKASGRALASYADNGDVYLTATAGSVDDAVVQGDRIMNARGASAVDAGNNRADFEIDHPFVHEVINADIEAVLDGANAKVVANVNVIGGIPVIHQVNLAAGTNADTDVTLTHKTRIVDAWLVLTGGGVGSAVYTVKNGANAITDGMAASGSDTAVVRATTMNDANWEIAAAGTLRVTGSGGATQPAATMYVLGYRVT